MKTPWTVQQGGFRLENSPQLVWIVDADGKEVIPWRGFDSMCHSKALRVARQIVRAVNAVQATKEAKTDE